jgi:hypothetical protein
MICPLQLRYALEARGYALALAFSIYASLLLFLILERPHLISFRILYAICVVAGVYSQPFSLFVPLAHLIWLTFRKERQKTLHELFFVAAIIVLSGLSFLPWYLYASGAWKEGITTYHLQGTITLRSLLMVLHELLGMGYVGSAIVLAAGALAATSTRVNRSNVLFWILYGLVPITCVLIIDKRFGYFLAIRQMIFIVAPASVLIALAIEQSGKLGLVLGLAFLITAVWNDVKLFSRPREDWQSAARMLKREVSGGTCVLFAPADSAYLYTFFLPELLRSECGQASLRQKHRVALAVSAYDLDNTHLDAERKLGEAGFARVGELNPVKPRIELYQREVVLKSN